MRRCGLFTYGKREDAKEDKWVGLGFRVRRWETLKCAMTGDEFGNGMDIHEPPNPGALHLSRKAAVHSSITGDMLCSHSLLCLCETEKSFFVHGLSTEINHIHVFKLDGRWVDGFVGYDLYVRWW